MDNTTPHAMRVQISPYGECGREATGLIIMRGSVIDLESKMTDAQLVDELRCRLASVIGCDVKRVNAFSWDGITPLHS